METKEKITMMILPECMLKEKACRTAKLQRRSDKSHFLTEDKVPPAVNSVNATPNPVVEGGTLNVIERLQDEIQRITT